MWHEKIFYGKCYLVVVWHSSTYKIVKVIKLSKKINSKDYGITFMIIITYIYNYYFLTFHQMRSVKWKKSPSTSSGIPWKRKEHPSLTSLCLSAIQVYYYLINYIIQQNKGILHLIFGPRFLLFDRLAWSKWTLLNHFPLLLGEVKCFLIKLFLLPCKSCCPCTTSSFSA